MKKTDLERNKGLQIKNKMNQAGAPAQFGGAPSAAIDRREQRKRDQAQGLIPFAVKLNSELVGRLQVLAQTHEGGMNALVGDLLQQALTAEGKTRKK